MFATQALIARAMADTNTQAAATAAFIATSHPQAGGIDLALGRAGSLLAAALLLDALPDDTPFDRSLLLELGNQTLADMTEYVLTALPISDSELHTLGIAHGWAGALYSALQWSRATGTQPPPWVARGLHELAALAEPCGRGRRWPWLLSRSSGQERMYMPGWCNGSSGYVFLWTLAARMMNESTFLDLAVGAAWDAWDAASPAASLCCGLIGQAYALLNLYKHTENREWLLRAHDLGRMAADEGQFEPDYPHSLYKGELALAVLAADLEQPEHSAQPFFEEEGWASI